MAIAVLMLALAACAPLPAKDAPPTFATARAADLVQDTAAAPATGASVPGDYGDAQLNRLIAQALKDSPTMAVAQARVRQADAAAGETESAAGATLAFDGQATRERYPQHSLYPPPIGGSTRTSGHVALDFSYDFDFWGRNRSALDAVPGRAAATRADARAAAATLSTGIARTYFQWQAADQHLRIAQTSATQRQALVERQARRVRAGLAPGSDLAPLDADAAAPRQNIVQLETQRAQAERQLQALVGVHALPAITPALLPAPAALPAANVRLDLLARRSEVAAARDRAQAALKDVDAQRAAFYPDISISALAGFDALQLGSLLHADNRELAATPAIHLPIFDAGRLRAGLDARRADAALAVAQYDQALQQAVGDVNDATVRVQGAQREAAPLAAEDLQHAKQSVAAAQDALDVAEKTRAAVAGVTLRQNPSVLRARAAWVQASLATQRNDVRAPTEGVVARRSVQVGQRVAPGAALLAVVPLQGAWIDANFKEPQLRHIQVGQPATVATDLYGGHVEYHGVVASIAAGSGGAFSLLPPQNATGNWIKVVQRVPVRIALDPKELAAHPLRVGLSTDVTIDTHDRSDQARPAMALPGANFTTLVFDAQLKTAETRADALVAQEAGSAQ